MDRPKSISRRRVLAAGTAGIVGAALPVAGQNADQTADENGDDVEEGAGHGWSLDASNEMRKVLLSRLID